MTNHITIVGAGNVGIELAVSADRLVPHEEWDAWLASFRVNGTVLEERDLNAGAPLIVLAVPEPALPEMVAGMVEAFQGGAHYRIVVHVNGVAGPEALNALRSVRCAIGVAHPFQTFGSGTNVKLKGVGWGVECDDVAWPVVHEWIDELEGKPHRFSTRTRAERLVYHAAAVAASNFLYAPIGLARRLAEKAGIPISEFIRPILEQTVRNAMDTMSESDYMAPFPITGPLVRGELATVIEQLKVLPENDNTVYRDLSLALLATIESQRSAVEAQKSGKPSTGMDESSTHTSLTQEDIDRLREGIQRS